MMGIVDALKSETQIRVEFENRWLYWDGEQWIVREQRYRTTKVLVTTLSERAAVDVLLFGGRRA